MLSIWLVGSYEGAESSEQVCLSLGKRGQAVIYTEDGKLKETAGPVVNHW